MVLFAEYLATLVEFADTDTDVIEFGIESDIYNLLLREADLIDFAQSYQETDGYRCTGGEASDGEGTLNDTAQTN